MMIVRKLAVGLKLARLWMAALLFISAAVAQPVAAPASAAPAAPGELDATFGGFGEAGVQAVAGFTVRAMALQPDGRVVAVGYRASGNSQVRRFLPNGQPDLSFGQNGQIEPAAPPGTDAIVLNDVAVQPDGAIVAVGRNTGNEGSGSSSFFGAAVYQQRRARHDV